VRNLLKPPGLSDKKSPQTARLLLAILFIMIGVTTLAQVVYILWIDPAHAARYALVLGGIDVSGLGMVFLVRKGYVTQMSSALILIAWAAVTGLTFTDGGIRAPEATAYFMIVFAAGFILGERAGLLTGVICILTGLALVFAEQAGRLPPSVVHQSSFSIWFIYSMFTLIIIGLQFLATRTIYDSYYQAQRELAERARAEAALRESEARFHLVLTDSPIFVYMTDKDLRYTWVNNPPRGFSDDELIGKTEIDIIQDGEIDSLHEFKQSVLISGVSARRIFSLLIKGREGVYDVSAEPLRNPTGEVVGLMAVTVDITERRVLEQAKIQSQIQLELHRLLIKQQEAERLKIARDLHDGPIQDLVGDILALQGLILNAPAEADRQTLEAIKQDVQQQIENLRAYAGELRPPALVKFGLAKAIRSHLDTFHEKNPWIAVRLDVKDENQSIPEEIRTALYRIYQECMTNAVKHAQAAKIDVRFCSDLQAVHLEVRDDGVGFELPTNWIELAREGHLGMVGIRERVEAVGGEVEIISKPGDGTNIRVHVPLASRPQEAG
jgi:PAS domain S-box-containing protein